MNLTFDVTGSVFSFDTSAVSRGYSYFVFCGVEQFLNFSARQNYRYQLFIAVLYSSKDKMKFYIAALFLIANVCHAADDAPLVVNDVPGTIPSVPVNETPIGPPSEKNVTTTPPSPTPTKPTVQPTPSPTPSNGTTTTVGPTTSKPTTASTTTVHPTPTTNATTVSPKTSTNGPTPPPSPSPTPKSTTVIPPNPSPSTTAAPATTPAPASHRKFDGPSFVGGIVLASGLMAIGFVAFKFYKARTELNYHTL